MTGGCAGAVEDAVGAEVVTASETASVGSFISFPFHPFWLFDFFVDSSVKLSF